MTRQRYWMYGSWMPRMSISFGPDDVGAARAADEVPVDDERLQHDRQRERRDREERAAQPQRQVAGAEADQAGDDRRDDHQRRHRERQDLVEENRRIGAEREERGGAEVHVAAIAAENVPGARQHGGGGRGEPGGFPCWREAVRENVLGGEGEGGEGGLPSDTLTIAAPSRRKTYRLGFTAFTARWHVTGSILAPAAIPMTWQAIQQRRRLNASASSPATAIASRKDRRRLPTCA